MIRYTLLPLVALLAVAAPAQTPPEGIETLGKSRTQILAMGRAKWFEHFTTVKGETTMSMSSAEQTWGWARQLQNDASMAGHPKRSDLLKLRKEMTDSARKAVDVARGLSGGGTIHTLFAAQITADVEDCLAEMLKPVRGMKQTSERDVLKELNRADQTVAKNAAAIDKMKETSMITAAQAKKNLADFRASFRRAMALTKGMAPTSAARLRGFYKDALAGTDNDPSTF